MKYDKAIYTGNPLPIEHTKVALLPVLQNVLLDPVPQSPDPLASSPNHIIVGVW